jgi:hypothetical protein
MTEEELLEEIHRKQKEEEAAAAAPAEGETPAPETPAAPAPETPAPETPAAPEPGRVYKAADGQFEIKLETGETFRGANAEELANNIAAAKTHATRAIELRDRENAELRQRVAERSDQPPQPPAADPEKTAAEQPQPFDAEKYFEMLDRDPQAALSYAASHNPHFQRMTMLTEQFADLMAVTAFHHSTPNFPSHDNEVAGKLLDRIVQSGKDLTPQNLTTEWQGMLARGEAQPYTRPVETPAAPAAPETPAPPPPPPPGGETDASGAIADDAAYTMPLDDLKAQIAKLSAEEEAK